MRITVNIEPKLLKSIISLTGEKKKSPAINIALREFTKKSKLSFFTEMIKKNMFDFPVSNFEIEEQEKSK